jgi:DNA-binding SARP family transcriptional activator
VKEHIVDQPVTFRLWGKVEASRDGEPMPMGSQREQSMLAGLIVAKGREIQRETLKEWIWDDEPASASEDINHFMSALRKRLQKLGFAGSLVNKSGLCRLVLPEESVDVHQIKALTAAAQKTDDRQAAELLTRALRMSEGEPLAGLNTRRVSNHRTELEKQRHALKIAYYRVELRQGRHQEHLGELGSLLEDHPHDAVVAALLMCALHFAGRNAEAGDVFREYRERLSDVGMDVLPGLTDLHARVLKNDLTADGWSFALGRPYSANGEPPMSPTEPLLVAIRPDAGSPDEVRRVAAESFGANGFRARQAEDCLVCVVSPEVAPAEVIGVWMDRLVQGMPHRGQVGIGMGSEDDVCDLARSSYARSVLDCAPDSNLVVAVSDDLYELVTRLPELQIDAASYRRDDQGVAGWVRVPGLSVPPRPRPDHAREFSENASAPAGPSVAFHGRTKIGKQVIASTVNKMKW